MDYVPLAKTVETVTSEKLKSVTGAIRYIENPVEGRGSNYYARRATLIPSGDFATKDANRQTPQRMTLDCEIVEPASGPDLVVRQQAV